MYIDENGIITFTWWGRFKCKFKRDTKTNFHNSVVIVEKLKTDVVNEINKEFNDIKYICGYDKQDSEYHDKETNNIYRGEKRFETISICVDCGYVDNRIEAYKIFKAKQTIEEQDKNDIADKHYCFLNQHDYENIKSKSKREVVDEINKEYKDTDYHCLNPGKKEISIIDIKICLKCGHIEDEASNYKKEKIKQMIETKNREDKALKMYNEKVNKI